MQLDWPPSERPTEEDGEDEDAEDWELNGRTKEIDGKSCWKLENDSVVQCHSRKLISMADTTAHTFSRSRNLFQCKCNFPFVSMRCSLFPFMLPPPPFPLSVSLSRAHTPSSVRGALFSFSHWKFKRTAYFHQIQFGRKLMRTIQTKKYAKISSSIANQFFRHLTFWRARRSTCLTPFLPSRNDGQRIAGLRNSGMRRIATIALTAFSVGTAAAAASIAKFSDSFDNKAAL